MTLISRPPQGTDGMPGEPGAIGIDGKIGNAGMPGRKGYSGWNGMPGRPGNRGLDGMPGERGTPTLVDGPPGEKGSPGYGRPGMPGNRVSSSFLVGNYIRMFFELTIIQLRGDKIPIHRLINLSPLPLLRTN